MTPEQQKLVDGKLYTRQPEGEPPVRVQPVVGPPTRKVHTLKIWPQYIDPIGRLEKTFEVRKCDRDFRVGDILHLREWFPGRNEWGARNITCFVTYIMHGPAFGIEDGYCVMGIAMPQNHSWPNALISGAAPPAASNASKP